MSQELLTERHAGEIAGVLSCFDRIVMFGTMPGVCHADGMTGYLYGNGIQIFDYPEFAAQFRDKLRDNAQEVARCSGLEIEHIRKKNFRKEDRIKRILAERGEEPGLVWVFSAMEPCERFRPWHDRRTGQNRLVGEDGKCIHYYFYFIDEEFGLGFLRVPTWLPCRLQAYFNGHSWLHRQMGRRGMKHEMIDNGFVEIEDWERAQRLADQLDPRDIHRKLDQLVARFCPIARQFGVRYHWSLRQSEYSTDIVFHRQEDLHAIYSNLTVTAIHTVRPDDIATFLGKKLGLSRQNDIGNRYNVRIEGTRIKHTMGPVSIKMYDKCGQILRIETTVNDVCFFTHYRRVEHRDGTSEKKNAVMKRTIHSLPALRERVLSSNLRYLEFISAIEDPSPGIEKLHKLSRPASEEGRRYAGFNFFDQRDDAILQALARGEFNIYGFKNKHIRSRLPDYPTSAVSRLLKRLRLHGLIKRVGRTYKYYVTCFGKQVIATGLKLRQLLIIPQLALSPSR